MEFIGERFQTSTKIDMDKVNEEMKKLFYCKCGVKLNRPHYDTLCWKCMEDKKKEEKRKWLVDRKYSMTLEERIAEIESWMYEHKQNHPQRETLFR